MRLNDFLIGCDPEFAVIGQQGEVVNQLHNNFQATGPVGWDHGGWVLECRPEPSYYARTLVKRIARLLRDERVQGLSKVRAGAYYQGQNRTVSLGGHVHLDKNPYQPLLQSEPGGQETTDHHARIGALDTLTMQLEHLDILPSKESEQRRDTTEYGKYGDVRIQGRAPNYRTEYRTMGSWLMSPSVAMLCLTGAKLSTLDPKGMGKFNVDYDGLKAWFGKYQNDGDVEYLQSYILNKPLKFLQRDPNEDFRERWRTVGNGTIGPFRQQNDHAI